MTRRLTVVGASLAGLRAVESAREHGFDGEIVLIGDEMHAPYDRPTLSKAFLTSGEDPVEYRSLAQIREDLGVRLLLGRRATGLDAGESVVRTDQGDVGYDTLIVATGASPRRLPFGHDLAGVHTLRTRADADLLRSALVPGSRLVVIGGGFIGSELASSARERAVDVTIVEGAPVPLVRAVGAELGRVFSDLHARNGVPLLCDAAVAGVRGVAGRVCAVDLADGRSLPADVVVVGIGAVPATDWLKGSGIALAPDGGVLCDERLATSLPDVYAAGDVVSWPNALLAGGVTPTTRLENWTSASDQGRRAAVNALFPEDAEPFVTVPYFWSDWYGSRIQFVGTADAEEVSFVFGDHDSDRFAALFRSGDRLVGAATLNEPRKVMKYRRHIALGGSWIDALVLISDPAVSSSPAS